MYFFSAFQFSCHQRFLSIVIFLLLVRHASFSRAFPSPQRTGASEPAGIQDSIPRTRVGFAGDEDVYGLGIRLGYYTQALSAWLTGLLATDEADDQNSVNILFQLAMFVGMSYFSRSPRKVFAVEPFMLIQITSCLSYLGTGDIPTLPTPWKRYHTSHRMIKDLSFVCVSAFNVWYWFSGLQHMKKTPGVSTTIWLFAQLDLYGWIKTYFVVLAIPQLILRSLYLVHTFSLGTLFFSLRGVRTPHFAVQLKESLVSEFHSDLLRGPSVDETKPSQAPSSPTTTGTTSRRCQSRTTVETRRSSEHSNDSWITTSLNCTSPLPNLTPLTPKSTFEPSSPTLAASEAPNSATPPAYLPSFTELHSADEFTNSVIASVPTTAQVLQTSRKITVIPVFLTIFWPTLPSEFSTLPSLSQVLKTILTHRPRPSIILQLALYLHHLNDHAWYRFPWLLHFALVHPTSQTLDSRTLFLVLSMRLTRQQARPRVVAALTVVVMLVILALLVASVEVTIQYNGIRGVQSMSSVGQLIPAVIGIGGLVRVVWGLMAQQIRDWEGRGKLERRGEVEDLGKEMKGAAEVYFSYKELLERREDVMASKDADTH